MYRFVALFLCLYPTWLVTQACQTSHAQTHPKEHNKNEKRSSEVRSDEPFRQRDNTADASSFEHRMFEPIPPEKNVQEEPIAKPLPSTDPASKARNQKRPHLRPAPATYGASDVELKLESIRRKYQLPSLLAARFSDGKLRAIGAVGARKAFDPTHIQLDDTFHLGSCTKAMTATLAAILVEKGLIQWTTPLQDVFPEWKSKLHPTLKNVNLKALLAHRSGLTGQLPQTHPALWKQIRESKQEAQKARHALTQALLAMAPSKTPGTQFIYSNAGYIVAAAMLEKKTKQSWEALTQKYIFQPLGMHSCGFGAPGKISPITQPWGHVRNAGKLHAIPPGPRADNPPALGPAGRVHCSIPDWLRFLQLHLHAARNEKTQIASSRSIRFLHTPHSTQPEYALGWIVGTRTWAKGRILTHAGSNTLFYANVWIAPQINTIVLAVTNQGGTQAQNAANEAIASLLLP